MNIDLFLLGLVLLFAFWGAFQGAARQVAQVVAGIAAWLLARPAGDFLGAGAAKAIRGSLAVGTVFATFATFLLVFVLLRWLLTLALQRLLAGKDPKNRTADRVLGFLIGAVKIAALTWVVICALTFVEDNITLGGKRFGLAPKDSQVVKLAHQYNLFELSQFSGIKDVISVARLQNDPKKAKAFKDSNDFQALLKDPRFLSLMNTPEMKKAVGGGDTRALLDNNQLLALLQDPHAMRRISRIAQLSDQ